MKNETEFVLSGEALLGFLVAISEQEGEEGLARPLRLFLRFFRPELCASVSQAALADAQGVSRWSVARDTDQVEAASEEQAIQALVERLDEVTAALAQTSMPEPVTA